MVQTLTSPNAHNYSEFGSSVAISGSLAVVGAYNENASGYSWAGHAYVFNAKTGALIQTLISPDPQADGEFGSSVSVSGNIAMVGAPIETVGGFSQAGCAYVFNAKTGALIQTLTSPNARSGYFGASIAISGSLAVAGVGGETAGGFSGAGHAYTYSKGWLYS
jgi:outer membrane protein assembly factor BamB